MIRYVLVALGVVAGCEAPASSPGVVDAPDPGNADDGAVIPACGVAPTQVSVSPAYHVVPIYLVATDTPAADADARTAYFTRSLAAIQHWYGEQMGSAYGNATFAFDEPRKLASAYTRAQWDDFGEHGFRYTDGTRSDGCGMAYGAMDELPPLLDAAGLPPLYSNGVYYLVVTGGGWSGGCGAPGIAAVEELELDRVRARCPNGHHDECTRACTDPGGLSGTDPWCDEPIQQDLDHACSALGAFAHEIGHGFGLPHGADRTGPALAACANKTLMDIWWQYDLTATLCDPDRADLMASGYFATP